MEKGKLFILSAPSGAGKTTILKSVMKRIQGISFSISHTTRKPRKGETNGTEYHFVDRKAFMDMCEKGLFLEYADVHGNLYGTSRVAVQQQVESGVDVVLDIDVQGAGIIKDSGELDAIYIFLAPPDTNELERRLRGRGLDDEDTIATRLKNARDEMGNLRKFDYLIVNDQVDEAIRMFESIILAERARNRRDIHGKSVSISVINYEKEK